MGGGRIPITVGSDAAVAVAVAVAVSVGGGGCAGDVGGGRDRIRGFRLACLVSVDGWITWRQTERGYCGPATAVLAAGRQTCCR